MLSAVFGVALRVSSNVLAVTDHGGVDVGRPAGPAGEGVGVGVAGVSAPQVGVGGRHDDADTRDLSNRWVGVRNLLEGGLPVDCCEGQRPESLRRFRVEGVVGDSDSLGSAHVTDGLIAVFEVASPDAAEEG